MPLLQHIAMPSLLAYVALQQLCRHSGRPLAHVVTLADLDNILLRPSRNLRLPPALQDSGTAIFLFAYFGYWLEVAFALSIRGARGELLTSKTLRIEEAVNKNKISPPVPNPKGAEACSSSGGGSGRSSPDLAMMKAMTQPVQLQGMPGGEHTKSSPA